MSLPPGTRLDRYEIRSLIGVGGMGEVYLAKDTRLGRQVALKLLSAEFTESRRCLHRFKQEARAASCLKHPNILVIHEISSHHGAHFIVTEFVEGETLHASLNRGRLPPAEALHIAAQVADALAAAHAQGIIHRDIKPSNVMVTQSGQVTVLDFGLAKLTEKASARQATDSDDLTLIKTDPRVVMGTPQYMSPEQARGLKVDERTDIFSLGVMLYQMIAGHPPFEGATTSHVIVSILEQTPAPPFGNLPETPDELKELNKIVLKTLEKNPEQRYQTVKDMAVDLRRLARQLDAQAELEHSARSASDGAATEAGRDSALRTGHRGTAAATPSVEHIVNGIRRHKRGTVLVGIFILIALVGIGYALYRFTSQSQPAPQRKVITLINSPGRKYVAYIKEDGGKQSLWVKSFDQLSFDALRDTQIVPPSAGISDVEFSSDNNYISYVVYNEAAIGILYQVPVLGGVPTKVLTDIDGQRHRRLISP